VLNPEDGSIDSRARFPRPVKDILSKPLGQLLSGLVALKDGESGSFTDITKVMGPVWRCSWTWLPPPVSWLSPAAEQSGSFAAWMVGHIALAFISRSDRNWIVRHGLFSITVAAFQ